MTTTIPAPDAARSATGGRRSAAFLSPAPEVRLTKAFEAPFANFLATARTCYSSKGIVGDVEPSDRWTALAKSLYQAGHHTTLQHAQFQFAIANVSRHFLWSFLHSHPFYNSEQVSQRYVEVRPGNVAVPPLEGAALTRYRACVERQMEDYHRLIDRLTPVAESAYYERFPGRRPHAEKYAKEIQKRAQEIARYVLPVATFAYLYHTVSGITLLRYARACEQVDAPVETRIVVRAMVDRLLEHDPAYGAILEEPLPLEATPEHRFLYGGNGGGRGGRRGESREGESRARAFRDEFDRSLDGRVSRLVDYGARNEEVLADAVREVLGETSTELSDDEAIALALDPAVNPLLGEALNLTSHGKLTRALYHPHYTFRKKLSHAGDSQDQRHRMTPASRPALTAHVTSDPDYVVPRLVLEDGATERAYRESMERTWEDAVAVRRAGAPAEHAEYLLPNAVSIRFTESADLLNLWHKHAMRLCYNAQEEIWQASLDEARQVAEVNPRIGRHLQPPCTIRHRGGQRPVCPEGTRFCGERVWALELDAFARRI
ncbi:MAG TPA: FAD-dependent thymidylate synthase [Gemmatimonadota bacterium]|nr:FAD-dependent thymidylate synthase [Gemmatimonadota bacterium]